MLVLGLHLAALVALPIFVSLEPRQSTAQAATDLGASRWQAFIA
jgi:ABC-type spermidine/putrescine transport system permease subunit I